jgi:hypothetical protein
MAITLAPRRFASWARDHRCRFDTTGFAPHSRISLDSSKRSGSMPTEPPSVALRPNLPADEHRVRSNCDEPSLWKKRRSIELYCTMPMVPA